MITNTLSSIDEEAGFIHSLGADKKSRWFLVEWRRFTPTESRCAKAALDRKFNCQALGPEDGNQNFLLSIPLKQGLRYDELIQTIRAIFRT
jgi:hypothetical protein